MKDKAHSGRYLTPFRRPAVSFLIVIMFLAAIIPAYAGNATVSISNSSESTYIIVYNQTSGLNALSDNSISSMVESYGGRVKYHYDLINGVAVTIPDDQVDQLKELPNVKYIQKEQEVHVLLNDSIPVIGANQVWNEGYKGDGVKVAVLDTGVDASHPDLNNGKVILWKDYINNLNSPYDDHGHGTHVSSIIAGTGNASNGKFTGVAPDASLIEAKVLNSAGSGTDTTIIAAIQWAVDNHAQIISMSLGGTKSDIALDNAVNNAVAAGVVVVVAAGNSGPISKTIYSPGEAAGAITVGAVDKSDNIASFSSRGPGNNSIFKPDVTNVGVNVVAARAWYNSVPTNPTGAIPINNFYTEMSGTSMATPMTAGVVALMLQKNSSLTPVQVKSILENTAKPMGSSVPNYDYGWGRVQAKYAVDNATTTQTYGPRTVWSDMGKNGSIVGRVTSSISGTTGVSGAYVALINHSNLSQVYNSTLTDVNGNYNFTGVNATYSSVLGEGPHGQATQADLILGTTMYQIYSNKSPYGSGYSAAFGIDANQSAATTTSVVLFTPPANITKYGPETVWSDQNLGGTAIGRVTIAVNGSVGIGGAYIALVNTSNVSQEFCHTYADAYGNYNITCINASYSSLLGEGPYGQATQADYNLGTSMYKIHAYESPYGDGYSAVFGVDANQSGTVTTSVVIFTKPASIDLVAERQYVAANGTDNVTITAYVYDALGYPVADGYNINFTIGNATNNGFTKGGFPWTTANGSLGSSGNNVLLNNPTQNNLGQTSVKFGWVDAAYSGNSTTVWAYYADDPSINTSLKIYYDRIPLTYNLVTGWNLIDVPFNISDNDIDDFLPDNVKSGLVDVWGWNETQQDFMFYSLNKNDWYYTQYEPLTTIETGRSYWVEMNKTATFTIDGTIPSDSPLGADALVKGWNFRGITGLSTSSVGSLYSNPIDVWGWNETKQDFMFYSLNKNDWYYTQYEPLDTIQSGHGYWIEMP